MEKGFLLSLQIDNKTGYDESLTWLDLDRAPALALSKQRDFLLLTSGHSRQKRGAKEK